MTELLRNLLDEIDQGDLLDATKARLKLMVVDAWRDGHKQGYREGATAGAEWTRAR